MRIRLRWLLSVLAAVLLAISGCAHAPGAELADGVLHLRTLVGEAPGPRLVEAELLRADGSPAELRLSWLHATGERERFALLPPELANELAIQVADGADFRTLLGPTLLAKWLPEGVEELGDPGSCKVGASRGGEGETSTSTAWIPSKGDPAGGVWSLALEIRRLPRYGSAWSAVLQRRGEKIETFTDELILSRFPAARAELLRLDDLAIIATCASEGAFLTADRIPLDLRAGAVRLLTKRAEALLDQGSLQEAIAALDHAETFAPQLPHYFFQRARSFARSGGDPMGALAALERAIEAEPILYRMEARVGSDFDALRTDPAFIALTQPRPLPATNRAGTRPPPTPLPPPKPEEEEPEPEPEEEPPPIKLPPPEG